MQIGKAVGVLLVICAVALVGCARLAFYSDSKLEGPESGVKFYYAKPYLLVSPTGNKDNPIQASIVYLPDQSKPMYAKLKSGYGSANLSLTLQNGVLTTVGQTTDTKIPETITALTGMTTAAAELAKLRAPEQPAQTESPKFSLYEIDNSSGTTVLKEVPIK